MGRTPKEKSKYYIYCEGQKVEVTEEVYRAYYGGKRSEAYQQERDEKNGLLYFSELEEGLQMKPEEYIRDTSISTERQISSDALMDALKKYFKIAEFVIIDGLYIRGVSMRALADEWKVSVMAIKKRRDRLLPKLKNFLKNFRE